MARNAVTGVRLGILLDATIVLRFSLSNLAVIAD
jgi:hypothetical protein